MSVPPHGGPSSSELENIIPFPGPRPELSDDPIEDLLKEFQEASDEDVVIEEYVIEQTHQLAQQWQNFWQQLEHLKQLQQKSRYFWQELAPHLRSRSSAPSKK